MSLRDCRPSEPGRGAAPDFAEWVESATRGDLAEAWRINDRTGQHWPSAHCLWSESNPLTGAFMVRFYHGLGDAVQMLRYAPLLARLVGRVWFDVPAPLPPLLQRRIAAAAS